MKQRPRQRLRITDKGAAEAIRRWWQIIHTDWKELVEQCGFTPGSDLEDTAYFMLMGFMTQDTRHISLVLSKNRHWLQSRRERARKYKIWFGNGLLSANWLNLAEREEFDAATVAFMIDVMVIDGMMEPVGKGYRLSKEGMKMAQQLPIDLPDPTKLELDRYTDDGNPNE